MHDAQSLPLDDQLEACHEQFLLHFVGHSPLTRDVAILEALISEMEGLAASAEQGVAEVAQRRLVAYREEHDKIASAQAAAGPGGRAAARQFQQAGFIMHRYRRHFAGQPRGTRDAGLLAEMNQDLQAVQANLLGLDVPEEMQEPLAQIDAHAQRLMDERAAVLASRNAGQPAERAAVWAAVANTLFATYNALAVGNTRLAVRPALLQRLIEELQSSLTALRALQEEGMDAPDHAHNVELVASQLATWQEEYDAVLKLRRQCTPDEIMSGLNEAMDAVLTDYNTKVASQTVTPPVFAELSILCDRMDEIERQLGELAPVYGLKHVHGHNAVARDVLALLVGAFNHFAASEP